MFTGCSASSFTDREPLNNIARGAIMSLVAVLSGTQAIHTTSYDEAYAIPSEESQRIALRTQQIIGYETDAVSVVDPMGGSYFLEYLTDKIEKDVEEEMARIEAMGGMMNGIKEGYIQKDIASKAYEEARKIQTGEKVVVGLNKFALEGESGHDVDIHEADLGVRERQVKRIQEVKKARNNKEVELLLGEIRRVAATSGNLMGPILSAVCEYATLGEICNALKDVFGEYREVS